MVLSGNSVADAEKIGYGLLDPEVLEVWADDLKVSEDGAIIENLEIRGSLRISANDVVVRNVWVYTTAPWTIYVEEGSVLIEHVEIGHPDAVGERGVGGDNVTGRYLDIHHVEDGIKLGNDVLYEYVRVHDLDSLSEDPHADAVQNDGGSANAIIRYSILDSTGPLGNGNASVILKSDQGPIDQMTISNSVLNGGSYTIYVRDGGDGPPSNVTFLDNELGPDRTYGIVSSDGPIAWAGNTFKESGEPVHLETVTTVPVTSTVTQPATTTSAPSTTSTVGPSTTAAAPDIASGVEVPVTQPASNTLSIGMLALIAASFLLGILVTVIWMHKPDGHSTN